jgi:hypothetical protein
MKSFYYKKCLCEDGRGGFYESGVHSIKRRAQLCAKLGGKHNKLSARHKSAWYNIGVKRMDTEPKFEEKY